MPKAKWTKTSVRFLLDKKEIKFEIIHNLADQGYVVQGPLLDNWLARTKKWTAEDLVDYINSKKYMTGCMAFTIEQYENIKASQ